MKEKIEPNPKKSSKIFLRIKKRIASVLFITIQTIIMIKKITLLKKRKKMQIMKLKKMRMIIIIIMKI